MSRTNSKRKGSAAEQLAALEAQRDDLAGRIAVARRAAKAEQDRRQAAMERVAGRVALAEAQRDSQWKRELWAVLERDLDSPRERALFGFADRPQPARAEPRQQTILPEGG